MKYFGGHLTVTTNKFETFCEEINLGWIDKKTFLFLFKLCANDIIHDVTLQLSKLFTRKKNG